MAGTAVAGTAEPEAAAATTSNGDGSIAATVPATNVVKEGDYIIWDVFGDRQSFVQVKEKGRCKLGKSWVDTKHLIGLSYGTAMELGADGELVKRELRGEWSEAAAAPERNNANLLDAGEENQKLTTDEIAELRAAGVSGQAIIDKLAQSSATFGTKTEFSQEKYRKKKAKKYCPYAVVTRPTARAVCEAYFLNSPLKSNHMRVDSLAIMLSLANVGANANVLVVDACCGLVTAAVAERMGARGRVLALALNDKPPQMEAMRLFNFPPEVTESVKFAALSDVLAAKAAIKAAAAAVDGPAAAAAAEGGGGDAAAAAAAGAAAPTVGEEGGDAAGGAAMDVDGGSAAAAAAQAEAGAAPGGGDDGDLGQGGGEGTTTAAAATTGGGGGAARPPRRLPGRASPGELTSRLLQGFDSLLVAAPTLDPASLLRTLLPLMAGGAAFVVFGPWPQPLAEAHSALQAAKAAVALQLHESWWREYQVLPMRTHPTMSTSGTGGYLLSGVAVVDRPQQQQQPGGNGGGGSGGFQRRGGGRGGGNKRARR